MAYLVAWMTALSSGTFHGATALFGLLADGSGYITDSSLQKALWIGGVELAEEKRRLLFYRLDRYPAAFCLRLRFASAPRQDALKLVFLFTTATMRRGVPEGRFSSESSAEERGFAGRQAKARRCLSASPTFHTCAKSEWERRRGPRYTSATAGARSVSPAGSARGRGMSPSGQRPCIPPRASCRWGIAQLVAYMQSHEEARGEFECCKSMLAQRKDFNLLDFWRLFDPVCRGFTTAAQITDAMKRIGFSPDPDGVDAFVSKHSLLRNGRLRYSDFNKAFLSLDRSSAECLLNRQSSYRGGFPAPHLFFSKETRALVTETLRAAVQVRSGLQMFHARAPWGKNLAALCIGIGNWNFLAGLSAG
ncbi:hypothetical protein BESB_068420 [Besnoitia besnoiti]|uniref:Uncharacterized protein n=1 Tax=Besnoitia besnoiti TaxID=94643 RepID=A0A2A9MA83_BESBE|nr:hypothetical protein BESB_068420 [Besnoitia besnoiti]PFH34809.1 hypothetical protein BESB_068420 [Besnoitia besnoiti]